MQMLKHLSPQKNLRAHIKYTSFPPGRAHSRKKGSVQYKEGNDSFTHSSEARASQKPNQNNEDRGRGWGVGGVYHYPISKQTVPFCKVKELYITYYSPFGEQNFAKNCLLSVQI